MTVRAEYGVDPANGNRLWERGVNVESGVDRSVTTHYTYDSYGNLIRSQLVMEDGSERNIYREYGSTYQGAYLTKVTVPYSDPVSGTTGNQITQFEHDLATGQMTATTDPMGHRTSFQYDALGRLTHVTNPDSSVRANTYDDAARIITVTLESGAQLRQDYDRLGRLSESRARLAGTWQVVSRVRYDNVGRKTQEEDALGQVTAFVYDGKNRLVRTTHPDGTASQIQYQDVLRQTTSTNPKGDTIIHKFDAKGRLSEVREHPQGPNGSPYVTQYTYDGADNLVTVTDARGHVTRNEHDALNRLRRVVYPAAHRSPLQITYNRAGEKTAETTNVTITYTYDSRGLLTRTDYPDGTSATFRYDAAGRRISDGASASGVSSTYAYDSRSRLTELNRVMDGTAYRLEFSYDPVGNITGVKYPGESSPLVNVYDELNRLISVNGYAGSVNSQGLWYDANGRLTELQYANGVRTRYQYDTRGRLTSLQSPVLSLRYTYDAAGNVTQVGDQAFTYDGLSRMLTGTMAGQGYSVSYAYDPVGNRTWQSENGLVTTYAYNTVNELTNSHDPAATAFTYDARGNLIAKVTGSETWGYAYDPANRLTSVTRNGSVIGTYAYDADGMRVKKTENGRTTLYLMVGHLVYYEVTEGTPTKHIYAGPSRIAEVRGGEVRFLHADHLGSTKVVTDGQGNVEDVLATAPFGQAVVVAQAPISLDKPLEVASDLSGRTSGPVTVVTGDAPKGSASLRVQTGADSLGYAEYGPGAHPEIDTSLHRFIAVWVKPDTGAEWVRFHIDRKSVV